MTKYIKLNNGVNMPLLGYGVYQVTPKECERCVLDAIDVGYRLIDTAQAYYNEEGVGSAIQKTHVPRSELFITTKVWISNAGESKASRSIDESLKKLQTDYIDLLLVHQPFGDYYGTYRAMQKAYKEGKVRAIGLSNFYDARFYDLAYHMDIKPAVVQLETNVFSQQIKMRELIKEFDTKLMAWGPLAQGRNNFFKNEILNSIGAKYGKNNAQVALKFLVEENIIAIPKSVNKERMADNLNIDDFSLSLDDMANIRELDLGKPGVVPDFNDTNLAKFLIEYDKNNNPKNR